MARGLRSQFVSKPPGGSALWTDPRLAPFLADRFFETAALSVAGTLAATLTPPQLAATGRIPVRGTSSQPVPLPSLAATARVHVKATAGLAALSPTLSGAGNVPVRGAGFAILQGIVLQGGGAVIVPAIPGFDYAPPVDLDSSAIIAQALRFMQLPPIARIPGGAELRPALADAFSAAIDDCLSACDWTFASTLAVLPAGLPSGTGDDSLTTVSVLPSDCLAVRRVTPAGARWRIVQRANLHRWLIHRLPARRSSGRRLHPHRHGRRARDCR